MLAEAYVRWQHAETRQWYVTQTDHSPSRPCPVAITRPIYPDHPMPIVPAAQKAEKPAPPVPVAAAVGLGEAWLPSTAKSTIRTAQQNGWDCRLTRATAGETYTLGLRCDRQRQRIAFTWKWQMVTRDSKEPRDDATGVKMVTRRPKGRDPYQEPVWTYRVWAWQSDGAWIMPPRLPVSVAEATQALADFDQAQRALAGRIATSSRGAS